jgi:zinc/manganese transport system ATP-binding protein
MTTQTARALRLLNKPHRFSPTKTYGRRGVALDGGRNRPNPSIELVDAAFGYAGHPAVAALSGVFLAGSLTALVGANGAGKSTLMKGLAGRLTPLRGLVLRCPEARVAYLPQQSELDPTFPITVGQTVSFGLSRSAAANRTHRRAKVAQALDAVGLAGFETTPLEALSGGQRQRILLARLIVQDADIVLLDEPFTGLESAIVERVLALLARWAAAGRVVVAAIHDIGQARTHFPAALLLTGDAPCWGASHRVLSPSRYEDRVVMARLDPGFGDA